MERQLQAQTPCYWYLYLMPVRSCDDDDEDDVGLFGRPFAFSVISTEPVSVYSTSIPTYVARIFIFFL